MTSTSDNPISRIVRARGISSPGGMSIARICGIEAGMSLLVMAHASQLRRENRERSGMLNASASGNTARTVVASVSTSAELRGTSSTEILIGSRGVSQQHLHCNGWFEAPKSLQIYVWMPFTETGNE